MTAEQAINVFTSFHAAEKKVFLANLMHALTIVARDSYEVGQDGLTNPQRVRHINEAQHAISGFLSALLRDDPRRYPDDLLIKIILKQTDENLERQLCEAFARTAALHAPDATAEVLVKG